MIGSIIGAPKRRPPDGPRNKTDRARRSSRDRRFQPRRARRHAIPGRRHLCARWRVDRLALKTRERCSAAADSVKPANNGPFYAAGLYPKLAEVFRSHGYALAVHGSLASDFDLVAVP